MRAVRSAAVVTLLAVSVHALWPSHTESAGEQDDGLAARVDRYLDAYTRAGLFSGVVLLAEGNRVLYERAIGQAEWRSRRPMQADAIFPIASLSKAFTAAVVVALHSQGRVALTDRLERFVPSIPNAEGITIEHLLRHTGGVGQVEDAAAFVTKRSLAKLVADIGRAKPAFAPGDGDQYSNEGYALLAAVVEKSAGRPYDAVVRDVVIRRLGLRDTGTDRPGPRRPRGSRATLGELPIPLEQEEAQWPGASGLQSTARDLHVWMQAVRAGRFGDYRRLPYPFGWGRRTYKNHALIEQSGSVEGFGSYMASYEDGRYVVVLSNIQSGMQSVWGPDFAALLDGKPASEPPALVSYRGALDNVIEGDYENPGGGYALRIRLRADKYEMTWGPFPFWRPLSRIGEDDYVAMADYTRVAVSRVASGVSGVRIGGLEGADTAGPIFRKVGP